MPIGHNQARMDQVPDLYNEGALNEKINKETIKQIIKQKEKK